MGTTYTYIEVNLLLTAADPSTCSRTDWCYTYNGNGSLFENNPRTGVVNSSTYNTAGY